VEVFIVVPVESAGARRIGVGFIVDASVPAVAAVRVEGD
jgi:hypothetical protein